MSAVSREKGAWEHRRSADWREERRKRAWELKQAGWQQKEIAVALGVTEGAVRKSDEKRKRRRGRSPQGASGERSEAPFNGRADSTHPSSVGERSVSLWISRGGLE